MIEQPLGKKTVRALGRQMAYHAHGTGAPILFLHGNPTSSYIWRNVMPALEGQGRLIAPDLIGMGDSEKLPDVLPDRLHIDAVNMDLIGRMEGAQYTRTRDKFEPSAELGQALMAKHKG